MLSCNKLKKSLLLTVLSFTLLSLGCTKNDEEINPNTPKGTWYLDAIFTYRKEAGKTALQSNMNAQQGKHLLTFNSDGTLSFQKLNIDQYGISFFTEDSYSGTYSISERDIKLTLKDKDKERALLFTIKFNNEEEFELYQEKPQILEGIELNKEAFGTDIYKEIKDFASKYERYEITNTFIKL